MRPYKFLIAAAAIMPFIALPVMAQTNASEEQNGHHYSGGPKTEVRITWARRRATPDQAAAQAAAITTAADRRPTSPITWVRRSRNDNRAVIPHACGITVFDPDSELARKLRSRRPGAQGCW
jgi:hypothetical protein